MPAATLTFKPFSRPVISSARFSASMLSSSIGVFLCSVDAAHMHCRGLRLDVNLVEASLNGLGICFSDPGSTFSIQLKPDKSSYKIQLKGMIR